VTAPCEHSCEYGEPYATSLGVAEGVLSLAGTGYVASTAVIEDFPSTELSVSFWVKVQPQHASTSATLLSYAVHDASHATNALAADLMEVMLSDTTNMRLLIHGRVRAAHRVSLPVPVQPPVFVWSACLWSVVVCGLCVCVSVVCGLWSVCLCVGGLWSGGECEEW
jgi:hypothetical protein